MPAVGTEKLVASQIGTDVVINVEHLKLAVQHAFVKGANDTDGDIEKNGWDFANAIVKQMILNKQKRR